MKSKFGSVPDGILETWFADLRASARGFLEADSGATAIEYGLIAALIAVVLITGATTLGTNLSSKFSSIAGVIGTTTP